MQKPQESRKKRRLTKLKREKVNIITAVIGIKKKSIMEIFRSANLKVK